VLPCLWLISPSLAVAIVETCRAHAAPHCARSRQHPPAEIKWQLTGGQANNLDRDRSGRPDPEAAVLAEIYGVAVASVRL
jgi:hypothetical protein